MDVWEWQMILSVIVLSPFAFIGIYKIFSAIRDFALVRRNHVQAGFFTQNRGFKFSWGKPKEGMLEVGKNKLYQYTPKKLYRKGHTPMALYNEDSIDQLDPLNTAKSELSVSRLSELFIRYFNLGVISTMSKEKMMTILLIVAVAGALVASGISFMNFQSMGMMDSKWSGLLTQINNKLTPAQPIATTPTPVNDSIVVIR